jgi:hypothetical protein
MQGVLQDHGFLPAKASLGIESRSQTGFGGVGPGGPFGSHRVVEISDEEGGFMSRSLPAPRRILATAIAILLTSTLAFAQGGSTAASLSGRVADTTGAVIPGADVTVKNNATGTTYTAVSGSDGTFTIPAVSPGKYTVTVALMGFKTAQLPDVEVVTATPASVRVTLEVGALEETVVVTGATEIVQTQSAAVQTTIQVKQIESLPVITRTALDYVVALPGVNTSGSGSRGSTINGLPGSTINITLDGVNVQDNNNRGPAGGNDGFFMYIRPMLDSVEEITVSSSTPGAESTGSGSSSIRMTTRSGTNRFSGSVYNTWRNQAGTTDEDVMARKNKGKWIWGLNTPYWFNKRDIPKTAAGEYFIDDIRLQTPGFRIGGPLLKDKLFYFFNWEWFLWPNQVNRTRDLLNVNAQKGLFSYPALDGTTRTIDLMALASANGQTSTVDPVIAKLLADIRSAAGTEGGIAAVDVNTDRLTYSPGGNQKRHFPTIRLDYNVTQNHRVSFTSRYNRFESSPDILNGYEPRFPGFPVTGGQYSDRVMWQASVRSTFGKNIVNEARVGYQGAFNGGTQFFPEMSAGLFNCSGLGCTPVGGQGYALNISTAANGITNYYPTTSPSSRYTPVYVYEDTLTWLKGQHTLSAGATYTQTKTENFNDTAVPTIGFGLNANDPAYGMLQATSNSFPGGINTTWAGYAQTLYAVLTGRVTSYASTAYLTQNSTYELLADRWAYVSQPELGFYVSDSWRWKPNLTLSAGLRYELQSPFQSDGNAYARLQNYQQVYGITGEGNLFKPGTLTGAPPLLEQYPKGAPGWNTDSNNIAPSLGATWRPNVGSGFLSKILSPDPVFRGGYSISFTKYGTGDFTGLYGSNPGQSRTASRTATSGTPVIGFDGWPVLLRDPSKLYAGAYPAAPTYPFAPAVSEGIYTAYPDLTVPFSHQWSLGWQRELGRTMALEVRYVGNKFVDEWTTWNLNDSSNWNLIENGFLSEYNKARNNLRANIAAGNGNTFAYTGAPGTSPLPIFMAYFAGIPLNDSRNQNPANYTSANFKSSSWYNNLGMYQASTTINSAMTNIAGTGTSGLQNSGFAANASAAGLPLNFFQANPAVAQGSANIRLNGGSRRYDGLQIELRKRMSSGFLVSGSYQYVINQKTWDWRSLREEWQYVENTASPDHSLKFNWVYELPFGQGKKWGSGVGKAMNYLIGGWEFDGIARVQSGAKFNIGGYRLVGMTEKELQGLFKLRKEVDSAGKDRYYMWPADVIDQSIIALTTMSPTTISGYAGASPTGRYIAPATGPDCVQYLGGTCAGTTLARILNGPMYTKFDFSFVKRFQVWGKKTIEARMDLYNVFNAINFNATYSNGGIIGGSTKSSWEITSAQRDLNASQDAGGRITQFGLRFTW